LHIVGQAVNRTGYYIKLLFVFMRMSLLGQLEYRINFISGMFVELAYMCIKLTYLVVVISAGVNIGSLSPNMVVLFIGVYCFMTGVLCFFWTIMTIPEKVIAGELDMMIVKPGSLIFLLTLGKFNFAMTIPNFLVGLTLIIIGWHSVCIPVTFITISGFIFFMLMGILLTYSFMILQAVLVFWVTSINGIYTLFSALWDFNNMPMALYGRTIQRIGTFVLPIFILTNWPGLFVLDKLSLLEAVWGVAVPVLLLLLASGMWKKGIRKYISANG